MPRHSPERERERSPARRRSSRRSISPVRATTASRKGATRSPLDGEKRHSKRSEAKSPPPRSPSPRTKRLRRVEVERNGRGRHREREKGSERDDARERGEKRSAKDSIGGGEGSKSRRDRLPSSDHRPRDRRERASRSPPPRDGRPPSRDARKEAHEEENIYGEAGEDGADDSISKMKAAEDMLESKQKQKPSFELSGKLASETNRVRGVTLLFDEPPDARKPDIRWRLYVFKAGEVLNEPLYIHRRSCYLFGRERRVADIPTDHPSCSKQHAVIQFRQVEKEQTDGMLSKQTRPYLMDLGSTNKTFLNDNPIEPQRYYELFEKDTIKLGNSSREYVLLHENSAT